MSDYRIYHNPRCRKSRETLLLLQEHGEDPEVILYLENAPDMESIRELLSMLGMQASELVRKGESTYKELDLKGASQEELIDAMAKHPILIERPIVIKGDRAVLGRPPENVLNLF